MRIVKNKKFPNKVEKKIMNSIYKNIQRISMSQLYSNTMKPG